MTRHTIERDSHGRVADISGTCGSERCPAEYIHDDGTVEYVCPESGDTLATVDADEVTDQTDDRRPATVDEIQSEQSNRRRRRRRRDR